MKIAIITTYRHPTRLQLKERSVMQSSVPELIASLCPAHAEIELYNEKEVDIPLHRHWDLVFFSYLHSFYEHTKVLSALFRARGMVTVAGGRHASYYPDDCATFFDAVVVGEPEGNIPLLIEDFASKRLKKVYRNPSAGAAAIRPYRYDLIDFRSNRYRLPAIEATRGCPFSCSFCVLTGFEKFRCRPVKDVVDEVEFRMRFNKYHFGLFDNAFIFSDNNLGGSLSYLKELCQALIPLRKTWGCALTMNILRNAETMRLLAKAGCRYVYTGLESLNPESLSSVNKNHNRLSEVKEITATCYRHGIILSFGMIIGLDGDTNEYLERVPEYLDDLGAYSVTYLGLVCPYPETPLFRDLRLQRRLLPGLTIRDFDGYTLCHRPERLSPSETIEHYQKLTQRLSTSFRLAKFVGTKFWASSVPRYKLALLLLTRELASIKKPTGNPKRTLLAGDAIEAWDEMQMGALGLEPQRITSSDGLDAQTAPSGANVLYFATDATGAAEAEAEGEQPSLRGKPASFARRGPSREDMETL
jgi:radical SAM superfamily enzyme YgiQ (UPF0313 family)